MADSKRQGVVLTSEQALSGRVLSSFQAATSIGLENVSVVTSSHLPVGNKLGLVSSSVDVILSVSDTPGHHAAALLSEFNRVLRPGGELTIQEPCCRRSPVSAESARLGSFADGLQSKETLERALTLSGFVDAETSQSLSDVGLASSLGGVTDASVGSSLGPLLVPLAVKVRKPRWETGASFSLPRQTKAAVTNGGAVRFSVGDLDEIAAPSRKAQNGFNGVGPSIVKLSVQDDDQDEFIDEDSLLEDDDMAQPAIEAANDDCEVGSGGRKACKDCSCGRAEQEAKGVKPVLTKDMLENPQSNCGNCGLGDAFRCGGCPYRGLPPFKPGEKITLPVNFMEEVL